MTARTRPASPPVACAHRDDARDCGECLWTEHCDLVDAAMATLRELPPWDAKGAGAEAIFARTGYALLVDYGIAPTRTVRISMVLRCQFCGVVVHEEDAPCPYRGCIGRRIRCEFPR